LYNCLYYIVIIFLRFFISNIIKKNILLPLIPLFTSLSLSRFSEEYIYFTCYLIFLLCYRKWICYFLLYFSLKDILLILLAPQIERLLKMDKVESFFHNRSSQRSFVKNNFTHAAIFNRNSGWSRRIERTGERIGRGIRWWDSLEQYVVIDASERTQKS